MASEWKDVTIEEIASKIAMGPFGSDIKTDNFVSAGVPIIRGGNLTSGRFYGTGFVFLTEEKANNLANANAFPGDIVFTHRGTLGQVGLIPAKPFKRYVVSQSQMKLTCDPKSANSTFIYYFFRSHAGQHALLMNTSQTGVPAISRPTTSLKSIRLSLPPLPEQRAIAHILGTLDDKIELNHRMNETLETMAQAIFKSWFVDTTTGGFPKGWKEGTVGENFKITMGQSPPGETYNEIGEGSPFFQGRTDFGFRFPALRVYCNAPTRIANPGDTLVCVRAPVGDVNMATQQCCVGRGLAAVRHKTGSRSYTYYAMQALREDFDCFEAEGTVFGSMNKKDFHAISYIVPPEEKVKDFETLASPLDKLIENNENESRTLAAIRDALLPKLLSGELRIAARCGPYGHV